MQSNQSNPSSDRPVIASNQPVAADPSDKSAPTELALDQLDQIGGGLGPNGTWASSSTATLGPNGTW
jgi:hypothetical protein